MYFGAGIPKLTHAAKSLRGVWEGTETDWRDQVRADIEQHELGPLLDKTAVVLRAMDDLAELMARINRECQETADGS